MIAVLELLIVASVIIFVAYKALQSLGKPKTESAAEKLARIRKMENERDALREDIEVTSHLIMTEEDVMDDIAKLERLKTTLEEIEKELEKRKNG